MYKLVVYNRLCIIMYRNFFIELLYFKRDKITRKTRHSAILPANVLLIVVDDHEVIIYTFVILKLISQLQTLLHITI